MDRRGASPSVVDGATIVCRQSSVETVKAGPTFLSAKALSLGF